MSEVCSRGLLGGFEVKTWLGSDIGWHCHCRPCVGSTEEGAVA